MRVNLYAKSVLSEVGGGFFGLAMNRSLSSIFRVTVLL